MAVHIRLSRFGRIHRPFFRVVATDQRRARDSGTALDVLGSYDPLKPSKNLEVDLDRIAAWLNRGAVISTALVNLLKANGYAVPANPAAARTTPKKVKPGPKKKPGNVWKAPTRRARLKHEAKLKAARKAAAAAAAPAPAAEAPAAEAPTA